MKKKNENEEKKVKCGPFINTRGLTQSARRPRAKEGGVTLWADG